MRKLLVLLVIVGLLIAGDIWLKSTAEKRVAAELQSSFAADGSAEVEFSGFPFAFRLLTGTIPSARISSDSLERDSVRFRDIRMTLQDVSFSWSKIMAGEIGSVTVRDGHGRAALPAPELVRAVGLADNLEITVDEGKLTVRIGPREATARVTLDGTDLVLRVPGFGRSFSVGLPRFVEGLQYRTIRVSGSEVIVEFSLRRANFRQL